MEDRLWLREIPIARRISGPGALGATLSRLSQSLYEEAERLNEEEAPAALDAYFQILSACIGRAEPYEQRSPQLRPRIRRFIDDHLSDPGCELQRSRRRPIFLFAICTASSQVPATHWAIAFVNDVWSSAGTIWRTRACAAKR